MSLEATVARLTRRVGQHRASWPISEHLRRYFARRYHGRSDRWAIVPDFDGDLRMRVDRAAYMGGLIYWRGFHATDELRALERILEPSMVLADVGANQGEFTLFAAKRLSKGQVLAFEPAPALYDMLTENVLLNSFRNVHTYNVGLLDRLATRTLYASDDRRTYFSVNEGLATLFPTEERSREVGRVPLETFDSVFSGTGIERLDVMKVDVEGAELPVLTGADESIRRHRPVLLIEVNEHAFREAGYSTAHLLEYIRAREYVVGVVEAGGRIEQAIDGDLPHFCNLLCRPAP